MVVDRQARAGAGNQLCQCRRYLPGFCWTLGRAGYPGEGAALVVRTPCAPIDRPQFDALQWRWLAAFIGNCTAERFARNKAHIQRIAHYSKACLVALREETGIAYDNGSRRRAADIPDEAEVENAQRAAKVLKSFNVAHRLVRLQRRQLRSNLRLATAPSLSRAACICRAMKQATVICSRRGWRHGCRRKASFFEFDAPIHETDIGWVSLNGVITAAGTLIADSYVVALANDSPELLRPVGINIPVYPVKGYAITIENNQTSRHPDPRLWMNIAR